SSGAGNAQPSWESKSSSGLMKLDAVVRGVVVAIFLARTHQRYGFVLAEPAPCSSSSSSSSCKTNDPSPQPSSPPAEAPTPIQLPSVHRKRKEFFGRKGDDVNGGGGGGISHDNEAMGEEEKGWGVGWESSRAEGGLRDGGSSSSA
ncbi:unnamed protein product, partial [Ectocarpus sp. 8 AP-2014]